MFRKLLSVVSTVAIITLLIPAQAFAVEPMISTIDLTVVGTDTATFSPSDGDTLEISVDYNTTTYGTILDTAIGHVKVMKDDGTELESFTFDPILSSPVSYGPWNGLDGTTPYPDGDYKIEVYVEATNGLLLSETKTKTFAIGTVTSTTATLSLTDAILDFAEDGEDEDLKVTYEITGDFTSLSFGIYDSSGSLIETYVPSTPQAASAIALKIWDGEDDSSGDLVDPSQGSELYSVKLSVLTTTGTAVSDPVTFKVAYDSTDRPTIEDAEVDPSTFDPDDESVDITFWHDGDVDDDIEADVWVEIQETDGTVVRTFSDYNGDSIDAEDEQTVEWDGDRTSGSQLSNGDYKVYIRTENSAGVDVEYLNITIDDDGVSVPSSNSHISGIDLDPSSTYEPAEDEELVIEYKIKKDLDELKIYAVKGGDEIELYDEDDEDEIEEDIDEYTITWDGTDDNDDYVEAGTWRIRFESKVGSTELEAEETIKLKFEEPKIDEFELSKEEIDPDLGETVFIIFKTDEDAEVDIFVYEDGEEEDEIEEDMEVEGDRWYAVEWDADGYDADDDDLDIEIKLVAKTVGGSESDSEKIDIDFDEDDVSSSKSNITNDYISPAAAESGDTMSLFYELEDDADVTITIHKGTSSSGSKVIELLDDVEQSGDDYEIEWDGKDDDGDELNDGFYTYKIVSKDKSTETETGLFAIGDTGDGDSSSSDNDGDISSNVKIVSGDGSTSGGTSGECGGYSDVSGYSDNCEAIAWVTSDEIFNGYDDGTFKPYQSINRAEVLKVLMEGLGMSILPADYTNLGFIDVDANAWYMPYIKTAKMAGIFRGDGGTSTARPGDTINRAELLKLTFETLNSSTGYVSSSCSSTYSDVPASAWYRTYACSAKSHGIFNSTILNASKLSTREEVAQMLYDLHLDGII